MPQRETYIVPRISDDEITFAAIHVEFGPSAVEITSADDFLERLKVAVTSWVATTKEGAEAWEDSSEDFNIGDLANERLDFINTLLWNDLKVKITSIDTYSTDTVPKNWVFDTVLVDENKLERLKEEAEEAAP